MKITPQTIWQNGKLIPWNDAKAHVLSQTLHYGSGAFEGIRFYQTANCPAIFRIAEHVDRLLYSTKILQMILSYSKDEIIAAIKEVVRDSKLEAGYIRPLAFYGDGSMMLDPKQNTIEFIIACWSWGIFKTQENIDVKISKYIRIHPASTVVDAKLCGHYVNSVLATLELRGTHYHEALLLDYNGNIAEGVGENFFMVKEGVIYTPKLGTILPGITRNTIIELAQKLGFKVVETTISVEQLNQADEAFFTGTAVEIMPIRSINDILFSDGNVGIVTAVIKKAYRDIVEGRNRDFMDYLTYI